jgi:hypothetical protein
LRKKGSIIGQESNSGASETQLNRSFTMSLEKSFMRAQLPLELRAAPLTRRGAQEIVQWDIARPDRQFRHERFRLYRGAPNNAVDVAFADAKIKQVIVVVQEASRAFQATISEKDKRPGDRVISKRNSFVTVERYTDSTKRHFLAGMDERHLFITQLQAPAANVREAHQALKSDEVRQAEKKSRSVAMRQGEWFLIALRFDELASVEAASHGSVAPVVRGKGIAAAAGFHATGRPHVADEVIRIGTKAYVRGDIKHPDHATVTLREWHRVIPNAQRVEAPTGVLWVD